MGGNLKRQVQELARMLHDKRIDLDSLRADIELRNINLAEVEADSLADLDTKLTDIKSIRA